MSGSKWGVKFSKVKLDTDWIGFYVTVKVVRNADWSKCQCPRGK